MAANQEQKQTGRPRKFSSPEDMQVAIDAYFAACEKKDEPLTIEGLCEALEVDRRTILNYGKLESYSAFFPTVKKARMRVQRDLVVRMLKGGCGAAAAIFLLKNNHGYEDEQTMKFRPMDSNPFKGMTPEQKAQFLSDDESE
ncbi:terminase small subunit [Alistipes onderdonkii]|jgi:hypothetical protein|uniref:terminase small subunit n=1 Tax=Alistipes onderdonkii TaxID=328813 RepID=UPI0034A22C1B